MVIEEQDCYYSDSDSDDDDVDRYVFLARQPAPAPRPAEDDRCDEGDGGDAAARGEESEGGVGRRKKSPLRQILDDEDAPPPTKKARLELTIASPLAAQAPPSGSESDLASSPRGVRAGESGSEGSHERRVPREGGDAKNATRKKRGACGKRSGVPGGEVDGDRDNVMMAAAKTGASSGATAASGRFPCSLCDRCFGSHHALGGHVLGHRKKAKIAIAPAPAACLDASGIGNCSEESAAAGVIEVAANGTAQAYNGDGNNYGHGDEDVHRPRHGKMDIGTASPDQKVVAGTCREGANGNGDVCRTGYKCRVCGTECPTGPALGGHMRKHWKRPAVHGGGGEEKPPSPATDEDCQVPLAQLFGAETGLQRDT